MLNILLWSSGYDSSVLLKYLPPKGLSIFHAYNDSLKPQLENVRNWVRKYGYSIPITCKEVDFITYRDDDYIPMRNTYLVMHALDMIADCNDKANIYIGLIKNEITYPDCSQEWVNTINSLIHLEYPNVNVVAPFINMTKDEVFELGCSLGVDINDTFSCNSPIDGKECGKCGNCLWKKRHKYKKYKKKG